MADTRKTALHLVVLVVAMFGFGFLLVPFYSVLCNLTKQNVLDGPDEIRASSQVDMTRTVTVEFDTNLRRLPWEFRALQPSVQVHPGQLTQVVFEVSNEKNRAVSGQAIPSYGPAYVGQFFKKVECFCFSRQTLGPRETRQMPVVFVLDPAIPKDVKTITLSYTFFEVEGNDPRQGQSDARSGA
ncbi:MAG TPA: cytochrome c oxidase assembly protein [Rhodocyclaceae bacterium]|nr:cytochrome c oxidase assembly protein [Rhodocyclaceae bacterium]